MKLGPYAIEQDYSHYVADSSEIILGIVGTASKGEIGVPTAVTSPTDLVTKFGIASPDHLGLYAANYFLAQSNLLWFIRAASSSAASSIANVKGTAGSTILNEALVLEGNTEGTYYNGFKVKVTSSDTNYTFEVSNKQGVLLEKVTTGDKTLASIQSLVFKNVKVKSVDETTTALTAGTYDFSGGNDGISDITPAEYSNAVKKYDTSNIDINLLSIPGVSDVGAINEAISVAESRKDTLYLVDPPHGLSPDQVRDWHNGTGEYSHAILSSSYAALYYDWQVIYDSNNSTYVDVPPSVVVAPVISYSSTVSEIWYPPAGLKRGMISGVINSVVSPDNGQMEMLYSGTNAVNCIINDPQVGLCVFGQKTLFRDDSALNRVNVRMLLNYLKKVIVRACRSLTFEPNDRITWNYFEDKIEPTLKRVQEHRGIYEYRIVKGSQIVTDDDIDNYRMPCRILIRPTKSAEEIPIYFTITSTGADFSDVLSATGIVTY